MIANRLVEKFFNKKVYYFVGFYKWNLNHLGIEVSNFEYGEGS